MKYISQTELPDGSGAILRHWVSALSFVEGSVLSDFAHLDSRNLMDVGRCAGSFVTAFSDFR